MLLDEIGYECVYRFLNGVLLLTGTEHPYGLRHSYSEEGVSECTRLSPSPATPIHLEAMRLVQLLEGNRCCYVYLQDFVRSGTFTYGLLCVLAVGYGDLAVGCVATLAVGWVVF